MQLFANGGMPPLAVEEVEWKKNSGTKVQNHRTSVVKFGRDLWLSSAPISPLKQGHLHLLPRTMSEGFLNISKNGDSTISLGKLCQCCVTLTVEKSSLIFRGSLLSFSFCSLSLVPFTTIIPAFFLHLSHLSWRYELAYLVWWPIPRHLNVIHYEIMFQH